MASGVASQPVVVNHHIFSSRPFSSSSSLSCHAIHFIPSSIHSQIHSFIVFVVGNNLRAQSTRASQSVCALPWWNNTTPLSRTPPQNQQQKLFHSRIRFVLFPQNRTQKRRREEVEKHKRDKGEWEAQQD